MTHTSPDSLGASDPGSPFDQFVRYVNYGIEPVNMPTKTQRTLQDISNSVVLSCSMLPIAHCVSFRDSAFFSQPNAPTELPSPSAARAAQTCQIRNPNRPPPVSFPSQGLLVKYGRDTSMAEAQCMWAIRRLLRGTVLVPEVYGWCTDNNETFVYMQLVQGVTLDVLWLSLSEDQRLDVCRQLRSVLQNLRRLVQDPAEPFVGDIVRGPIRDYIFVQGGLSPAGPFSAIAQLHDHLALAKRRKNDPHYEHSYRYMLQDEARVVFTHGDLSLSNILVSHSGGDTAPQITALVDWHQAGWMPDYWESYKLRWTLGDEWAGKYLHAVLDPLGDEDDYHYWLQYIHYLGLA